MARQAAPAACAKRARTTAPIPACRQQLHREPAAAHTVLPCHEARHATSPHFRPKAWVAWRAGAKQKRGPGGRSNVPIWLLTIRTHEIILSYELACGSRWLIFPCLVCGSRWLISLSRAMFQFVHCIIKITANANDRNNHPALPSGKQLPRCRPKPARPCLQLCVTVHKEGWPLPSWQTPRKANVRSPPWIHVSPGLGVAPIIHGQWRNGHSEGPPSPGLLKQGWRFPPEMPTNWHPRHFG